MLSNPQDNSDLPPLRWPKSDDDAPATPNPSPLDEESEGEVAAAPAVGGAAFGGLAVGGLAGGVPVTATLVQLECGVAPWPSQFSV